MRPPNRDPLFSFFVCALSTWLSSISIIAQAIIEMRALRLVENYVISRYNHLARGDYNTKALIFKTAAARFLDVFLHKNK